MARRFAALLFLLATFAPVGIAPIHAGQPAIGPRNSHNKYGSPLDTLKNTHLWAETAPAQDFVKDSRPDPKSLAFQPLTGADPARPKPRDAANVLALQAELERARATNEKRGRAVGGAGGKRTRKASASP